MAGNITRWYDGPLDEIVTILLDGTEVVVARGDPITSTTADIERLDAQPSNWSKVPPGKPRTIPEILFDVDGDPERAAAELATERARGDDARVTLVADLEAIIAGSGDNPKDGD